MLTMYEKSREQIQEEIAGPYNIEAWYPLLKDYTMETLFVPLTLDEAKTIQSFQNVARLLTKIELQYQKNPQLYTNEMHLEFCLRQSKERIYTFLHPEEKQFLSQVEEKLEKAITYFDNRAFVKLSARSPKDAALTSTKMKNVIKEIIESENNIIINNMETEEEKQQRIIEEDEKNMIAFTIACGAALQVTSVNEAMDLLLYSNRVDQDIGMHKLFLGEENFVMNLVIRRWEDLPFLWEFRCVVFNDEVTLINHYYSSCYLRELPNIKDKLQELILAKIEEIHPILNLNNYTIDFAYDINTHSLRLIEINNPPPVAGLSFLEYENEEERKLIHEGPFRFLFHTKPVENPYHDLDPLLHKYMLYLRGRLREEEGVPVHNGIKCNRCNMDPILTERFCCIECSGGTFSVENDDDINSIQLPDDSFNLCCFCYSARDHPHTHHFKVFLFPDENVFSLFDHSPKVEEANQEGIEMENKNVGGIGSLVRNVTQRCIIL